jgi:hypothetical protein
MKKIISFSTLLLMSSSIGFCQFGGLLGGGKKSSSMDKDAYMAQGKELIQGYALLQAAVLEVGAAQALAEGKLELAEELKVASSTIKKAPTGENFEMVKQYSPKIEEMASADESESAAYTEKGKAALKATLPKSLATVAGAVALGVLSVDWLKEYPNQLKAAGTFGKLKLVKELKVPIMIAKELPSSLVTIPKTLKAITAKAKKQGVDTEAAEKVKFQVTND